ncbi:sugar ABC transporter substrate-binding protein [Nocardioides sp.]|uniref:sugar ABC transporter substrate-binding protein n=1 Tax=Nocardioides sp. TaxID=35761 RepID=UPI0039E2A438
MAASVYESFDGTPFDASKAKGKTVYYIPLIYKASYFPLVTASLEAALQRAGATLHMCDGGGTPTGIASCMNQAVAGSAAGVITDYIPYEMVPTSYDALTAKGIPVYLSASLAPNDQPNTAQIAYGSPDPTGFASVELAADSIISSSDAQAELILLKVATSAGIERTADHAESYLEKTCPSCEVHTITVTSANRDKVASLISSTLLKYPSSTYVLVQTETYLNDVISGISTSGRTGKVKIATASAALAGLQKLETDPDLLVDVGLNPAYIAWGDADAILRMIAGEVPPSDYPAAVRAFTPENVGSLELTDEAAKGPDWFGTPTYEDSFVKLWGLS